MCPQTLNEVFFSMKTIASLLALGVCFACSNPPPPEVPPPPPPAPLAPPPPPPPAVIATPQKAPTQATVAISDRIRAACGIQDHDTLFAYDSAQVSPQARNVLQQLATCFTTGPLKDEGMRLVGHADPRGDEEYNMALGGRRAENVKRALVQLGMRSELTSTSSRGEMDAMGTDEAGWARDRKVEVMLAE